MKVLLKKREWNSVRIGNIELWIEVIYDKPEDSYFRITIQTGEEGFAVVGMSLKIFFEPTKEGGFGSAVRVWVGHFDNEQWIPTRLRNGDESWHNELERVFRRTFKSFVEITYEERLEGSKCLFTSSQTKNCDTWSL